MAAIHGEITSGGVDLKSISVNGSVQGDINGYQATNRTMTDVEVRRAC